MPHGLAVRVGVMGVTWATWEEATVFTEEELTTSTVPFLLAGPFEPFDFAPEPFSPGIPSGAFGCEDGLGDPRLLLYSPGNRAHTGGPVTP
jgi:hypothetical protein